MWLRSLAVLVYPDLLDAELFGRLDIDFQHLSGYVMRIAPSDTGPARHLATLASPREGTVTRWLDEALQRLALLEPETREGFEYMIVSH